MSMHFEFQLISSILLNNGYPRPVAYAGFFNGGGGGGGGFEKWHQKFFRDVYFGE